ncbi:MAG: FmdB family transcriptional regulator, partial [Actinobacteria bacterium]|nr:FmdB family transcriptional regulator [Actinomycetota bacterium]
MPTYEYVCRECGQHLEVVQSFSDDPLDTCERCGGALRKVFSAAGIIFKGSGYYVTDSRAARGKATASAAGADGSSTTDTSSESSSS